MYSYQSLLTARNLASLDIHNVLTEKFYSHFPFSHFVYIHFVYSHFIFYFDNFSHSVYSHIPISSTGCIQPTQNHNDDIDLYYTFCSENITIWQSNLSRPRSDIRKLVWFYPAGVPISLIIQSQLFCMENMAIRQIKPSRHRSDLRMYHY